MCKGEGASTRKPEASPQEQNIVAATATFTVASAPRALRGCERTTREAQASRRTLLFPPLKPPSPPGTAATAFAAAAASAAIKNIPERYPPPRAAECGTRANTQRPDTAAAAAATAAPMLLLPPLPPMPPLLLPRKAVTRRIGSIRLPTRHNPCGGRARCDDADDDDSAPPPGPPHAGTTRTPTSVRAPPRLGLLPFTTTRASATPQTPTPLSNSSSSPARRTKQPLCHHHRQAPIHPCPRCGGRLCLTR